MNAKILFIPCYLLLFSLISFLNCTPPAEPPAGHQPEEEEAVLETLDRYMLAISANDLQLLDAMQTPDGMTYTAYPDEEGEIQIRARSNAYWVEPEREDSVAYHERYWNPTVLIRGSIATVWTPYEYKLDGITSHCGVDVFSFVKMEAEWIVSNAMWTIEPQSCEELYPEDPAMIRPKG